MAGLTRDDLSVIEGDARISDRRIAKQLGYNEVENLQRLIQRNEEELSSYGVILRQAVGKFGEGTGAAISRQTDGKLPRSSRGRPEMTYLLTEEQALLVCMFARTAHAREARRQIISVFVAWRRGDIYRLAVEAQVIPSGVAKTARGIETIEQDADLLQFIARLPHLPIWIGERRPDFWKDIPVRKYLTAAHRQMTIPETVRIGRIRFGERCPGRSVIGRYWVRLDRFLGPKAFAAGMAPQLVRIANLSIVSGGAQ